MKNQLLNQFDERGKRQVNTDCDDETTEEIPIEPSCNSTDTTEINEETTSPVVSLTTCPPGVDTTEEDSVTDEFECEVTTSSTVTTTTCYETEDTENTEISSEPNTSEPNCEEINEEATTNSQVLATTTCQPEGDTTESDVTTEEFECEETSFSITTQEILEAKSTTLSTSSVK